MKDYQTVEKMLDDILDATPAQLFAELSGGVMLSESVKRDPRSLSYRPLYILGEYHNDPTGRYIVIYYGSFNVVYGGLDDSEFFEKLRHTFAHELRHHMESRSGIRDLERYDDERFGRYISGIDIAEFHEPPIE